MQLTCVVRACRLLVAMIVLSSVNARGEESETFRADLTWVEPAGVECSIVMARGHHVYRHAVGVETNGVTVALRLPDGIRITDKVTGEQVEAFEGDVRFVVPLPARRELPVRVRLAWQGCNAEECFFPDAAEWVVGPDGTVARLGKDRVESAVGLEAFRVAARESGFMSQRAFLGLLDAGGGEMAVGGLAAGGAGVAATLALILVGGAALNLTPCVLPLIPINLAILGAGSAAGGKTRGFLLGSAYGAGMALAYGGLGLVVVLTGSRFGALNASPWFNLGMAIVFGCLGLAMFDLFSIDLSRFQGSGPRTGGGGGYGRMIGAMVMGALSALLAGACVAPVVISVLLLATRLHQQGSAAGLFIPFVLGLGMALPWPLAAAGLGVLPKPGRWMIRVKQAFGVLIIGLAGYYGYLGWTLVNWDGPAGQRAGGEEERAVLAGFEEALQKAGADGKPLLVDFWASWCKNCVAMERSTLQDPAVRARLERMHFYKFQVEHPNSPQLKPMLDRLNILGLPTYVLLVPAGPPGPVGAR